jgi:threonine/homoserine/homoserine lactone efflux protein
MISLGLIFTSLVVIIFCSIATLTSLFKKHTPLNTINHRYFDWLCATVFIVLSLHLLSKSF